MADHPETTAPELPARLWRRRALWAAGILAVLAAVIAAVAVNRAPIAEKLARDRLTAVGLGGSGLAVTRLTPWRVEIENLTTGPAGTARIARLGMDLSWPSWTAPVVTHIALEGVNLTLAVSDGALDWGDLAPLLREAGGGPEAVPEITLTDALIDIVHGGGPTVLSLAEASLTPGADGAVILERAALDIVHPHGRASLRAGGRRAADGKVTLDVTVADAEGAVGAVSLSGAEGGLRLSGDPARPLGMTGRGDLELSGLALPGGLLAGGRLAARVEGGRAEVTADLADAGLGLTLTARAEGGLSGPRALVAVTANVAAADLARLPLATGVTGAGALAVTFEGPLGDMLSGDPDRLPPAEAEAILSAIEHPGIPGIWTARARAGVGLAGGTATLTFADPVEIAGRAWGGDLTASVPGKLRLRLSPFAVEGVEIEPLRVTMTEAAMGGVSVKGPLTLVLTPRDGGLTPAPMGGTFPVTKADFDFRTESSSLRLRGGGQAVVLRTARTTGGIAVTMPDAGPPAVRLDLTGLDAHAPDLDLEARGLTLNASGRAGPGAGWTFRAGAKSLRHTAVAPFAVTAKGKWRARKWDVEGTLRQERGALTASFAVGQDMRTEAGRARLDTLPLNLTAGPGGVHAITPLLAPFVRDITGTVRVSATAAWDRAGARPLQITASLRGAGIAPAPALLPTGLAGTVAGVETLSAAFTLPPGDPAAGTGAVAITGGNLNMGVANMTGIAGRIELDRLWPPLTPPGQEIRIARVAAALPAADGRLKFQVLNADTISVERAELTGIGGRIWAENVAVTDGALPERIVLNAENLGLADLAAQMNILGLKAEGRLSGRVPLELDKDGAVVIRGGLLEASDKGLVAFVPPGRAPAAKGGEGDRVGLVLDVLEDLRFDGMTLSLDGDVRRDVRTRVRIQGRNPKIQRGRPVDLTVTLTGNIGEAIQAEFRNFDIKGLTGARPLPGG